VGSSYDLHEQKRPGKQSIQTQSRESLSEYISSVKKNLDQQLYK